MDEPENIDRVCLDESRAMLEVGEKELDAGLG